MIHSTDDWQKYMQAALERGWPLAILVQTQEKVQHQTQHGEDQATPSRQRDANYIGQDESEEIENHNIEPQGLADEGEMIHNIVDEMEAEDQAAMEMEEYEGSSDDESTHCQKSGRSRVLAIMSQKTYKIRSGSTEGMRKCKVQHIQTLKL